MRLVLLAGAVLAASAAHAQVQIGPNGAVTCPGGYYAQTLSGELRIVCPTTITPEEAHRFNREQAQRWQSQQDAYRQSIIESGVCDRPGVPSYQVPPICGDIKRERAKPE